WCSMHYCTFVHVTVFTARPSVLTPWRWSRWGVAMFVTDRLASHELHGVPRLLPKPVFLNPREHLPKVIKPLLWASLYDTASKIVVVLCHKMLHMARREPRNAPDQLLPGQEFERLSCHWDPPLSAVSCARPVSRPYAPQRPGPYAAPQRRRGR